MDQPFLPQNLFVPFNYGLCRFHWIVVLLDEIVAGFALIDQDLAIIVDLRDLGCKVVRLNADYR